MTQWGSGTARAVMATLGACLLVTLVGWAALVGPSQVLTGPGPAATSKTTSTPTETPLEAVQELDREDIEQRDVGATTSIVVNLVGAAIQLTVLALMLGVAVWLLRRARRAWQLRRRPGTPDTAEFDVLRAGSPDAVRRTVADDADAQLALLLEGEPRNAIVATWHRFEVQAERSGLERRGWETSSELARRMLDVAQVDSAAVIRLLELYREARFSEHPLGEREREAARAALEQIQSQAGAGSVRS